MRCNHKSFVQHNYPFLKEGKFLVKHLITLFGINLYLISLIMNKINEGSLYYE